MKISVSQMILNSAVLNLLLIVGPVIMLTSIGLPELVLNASNEDYVTTEVFTGCNGTADPMCINCYEGLSEAEANLVHYGVSCNQIVRFYFANIDFVQVQSSGGTDHIAGVEPDKICYKYYPCIATDKATRGWCEPSGVIGSDNKPVVSCVSDTTKTTYCKPCCEGNAETYKRIHLTIDNQTEE
jgi:hypothetical protein